MLVGLRLAIENRLMAGDVPIVVAHFADSFSKVQQAIETWGIDYDVVAKPIDSQWLAERIAAAGQNSAFICLAEMLGRANLSPRTDRSSRRIGMMIVERHPLTARDDRIEEFCRSVSSPVDLGYFFSFDDPVVREWVSESALKILELFGMRQNELVTSKMISRRLKQALVRNARLYTTQQPADSASEWMAINRSR